MLEVFLRSPFISWRALNFLSYYTCRFKDFPTVQSFLNDVLISKCEISWLIIIWSMNTNSVYFYISFCLKNKSVPFIFFNSPRARDCTKRSSSFILALINNDFSLLVIIDIKILLNFLQSFVNLFHLIFDAYHSFFR